jgi:hypothetical protein
MFCLPAPVWCRRLRVRVQLAPTFREPKMDGTPLEPYTYRAWKLLKRFFGALKNMSKLDFGSRSLEAKNSGFNTCYHKVGILQNRIVHGKNYKPEPRLAT